EIQEEVAKAGGFAPSSEDVVSLSDFSQILENLASRCERSVALLVNFSSQLVVQAEGLNRNEHDAFTKALVVSHKARSKPVGNPPRAFYNTVVWIADKEGDLPDWLIVENPKIRSIPVSKPDHNVRRTFAPGLLQMLSGYDQLGEEEKDEAINALVEQTEGFLLLDLVAVIELARAEDIPAGEISDAIRRYKVGVTEDPWKKIDRHKIREGQDFINRRVKGQKHAVTHMLDIVKRAITGVGSDGRGGRPRGVVFLAGPTGVGKTELAKTITSLLFGDDNAYIRFDMSEFSAEHSDQRLIGSPPGYVGYDLGGELTNAIREKPFSVVLFDEIEKAHPRILDKFLQILDDGVLTSGRGEKVYFSEAFVVFTSNLGIYKQLSNRSRVANVTTENSYEEVESQVKEEIGNYFKLVLNRPEILNRIGENVIVFDFIRQDVAKQIFHSMMDSILKGLSDNQKIGISLSLKVDSKLEELCLKDLSNGGRGIRNMIEAYFVNPLSRALFDEDASPGEAYTVSGLEVDESGVKLSLS
ncbi:MAG: AAA family ATPase, partial [Candidatus Thiodiazotropha sp. (ex Lucinoma kastoroae)]|nr:AAA family ATPase [Candidatus Thiodiazotropha sp. (ex Lucinoma kastoroae)]